MKQREKNKQAKAGVTKSGVHRHASLRQRFNDYMAMPERAHGLLLMLGAIHSLGCWPENRMVPARHAFDLNRETVYATDNWYFNHPRFSLWWMRNFMRGLGYICQRKVYPI